MTSTFRGQLLIAMCAAALSLVAPRAALAHGKELEKKGGGPARAEPGPHGGAVIDIGDGHFELTSDGAGNLSLYRLDDSLKVIPAEDVDSAQIYAMLPGGKSMTFAMQAVTSAVAPLHFVAKSGITARGGFLAVISVAIAGQTQNLRFQVK